MIEKKIGHCERQDLIIVYFYAIIVPTHLCGLWTYRSTIAFKKADIVLVPWGKRVVYGLIANSRKPTTIMTKLVLFAACGRVLPTLLITILDSYRFFAINPGETWRNFLGPHSAFIGKILPISHPYSVINNSIYPQCGELLFPHNSDNDSPNSDCLGNKKVASNSAEFKDATKGFADNLTSEQMAVVDSIYVSRARKILMQGSTGSGKTFAYVAIAMKILVDKPNAQILILAPEIMLAEQIYKMIVTNKNNSHVKIWHSKITKARKKKSFDTIASGETSIIVGARSSIFLPFRNLCAIIVDEEQDEGYKESHRSCRYNVRKLSEKIANIWGAKFILVSATPSIETILSVKQGACEYFKLPGGYNPLYSRRCKIVPYFDKKTDSDGEKNLLSDEVIAALEAAKMNQHLSFIFLNNRGYESSYVCSTCNRRVLCARCDVDLVKHLCNTHLLCHLCGAQYSALTPCCKQSMMLSQTFGVEKIGEELNKRVPHCRTVIVSSDTINTARKAAKMIHEINNSAVDIIVGTQILAKGHNFKNLELGIILDLSHPKRSYNLDAKEKWAATLYQVAGRIGRFSGRGQIIIQSKHKVTKDLIQASLGNWKSFYDEEFRSIETLQIPIGRMVAIIFCSKNQNLAMAVATDVIQSIKNQQFGIHSLFSHIPIPAPVFKQNNFFRFYCLFEIKNMNMMGKISQYVMKYQTNSIKIIIDSFIKNLNF